MAIFISLSVTDKTTSKQDAATVRTALLEEAVGALQPIFGARGASATRIQAVLGRSPDKDATFSLSVHLHLPGQRIVAVHSKGDDLRSLARDVIDKLTSATRRHLERLAHGSEFARKRRRERLYEITTGADQRPERERSLVEARLAEIRPKLETAARRELAYLRAVSKLPTGYPEAADIVDEAIMRVIASDHGVVDAGELKIAALRELFAVIDAEIAAQQISMSAIPLDSEVPQDAEDEAEAMVEEEFYELSSRRPKSRSMRCTLQAWSRLCATCRISGAGCSSCASKISSHRSRFRKWSTARSMRLKIFSKRYPPFWMRASPSGVPTRGKKFSEAKVAAAAVRHRCVPGYEHS